MEKTRVLCFGDSNTWGYNPRGGSRYSESVRWTGVLRRLLGPDCEIIEEGLNGRTTIFDYDDRPGKVGLDYLRPCLDSHHPLDIVFVMLGTNDAKAEFNRSPEDIAEGLEAVVEAVLGKGLERPSPNVKLLLAAPPLLNQARLEGFADFEGAEAKTRRLPPLYAALAKKYGATFVDFSDIRPSEADGCHLDPEAHAEIAKRLFAVVSSLFVDQRKRTVTG